jgi:hypothetical protein
VGVTSIVIHRQVDNQAVVRVGFGTGIFIRGTDEIVVQVRRTGGRGGHRSGVHDLLPYLQCGQNGYSWYYQGASIASIYQRER